MSKSRRSKTLAAGALIGLTPYSKQYSFRSHEPATKPNRQLRRAKGRLS